MEQRERDFERLLMFVDAIVAIAVTLLILPLVDSVKDLAPNGSVADLISDDSDLIGGFLLSFVVIAGLWLSQRRMLAPVVRSDEKLTRALLAWCLTIVVLPFPTALAINDSADQTATKLLYVGTMAVSSAILAVIAWLVKRDRTLRDSDDVADGVHASATFATFVVALVIMVAIPATSYWPLLLLLLPGRIADLVRGRRPAAS